MSGHTPGPWSLRRTIYFLTVVAKGGKRGWRSICQLAYCEGRDGANARLIAAAPELLKACRAMRFHADTCQKILITDHEIPFPCNCGYDLAQAAIDKAEAPHA